MKRGFTLIETLIAISILVLAVTGAFAAAQNGISSATFSKDQIIAFYLAQEGMEEVRNLRDQNGISSQNWLKGIAQLASDPCFFGKTCMADAVASSLTACSGGTGSCPVLRQDPTSGLYGYDPSWTATPFKREIQLTSVNASEAAITVRVTWSKGLLQRSFKARENILNWQ